MASTRTRFTVSYVLLSIGAMLAFAIALGLASPSVEREQWISEATDEADRLLAEIR